MAIGIASRNILGNLLSGVMLYFDRPFNVGDWIRLPEKNTEGWSPKSAYGPPRSSPSIRSRCISLTRCSPLS
ncbi:mechanosensitive ion channel family protein [Edwardsiella tarda]